MANRNMPRQKSSPINVHKSANEKVALQPPNSYSAERLGLRTILFVIFLCAIWGGLSPALKISLQGVPPLAAAAYRFLIALICLILWAALSRIRWWCPAVSHLHLLAFAAIFVLQISVFNLGTDRTSSSHSIVLLSTNPLFVALGAHFLIPNDSLTLRRAAGLLLAFSGTWVIFAEENKVSTLNGDTLALLAGFLLGLSMVYSKFLIRHLNALEVVLWQLIYGVPVFFLLTLWLEPGQRHELSAPVVAALFYQGAIVAAFCCVAWTGLLRRHSVSQVSAFNFTTPFLGVLLSWLLLAEPISSRFVLGVSLIAVGIYLVANRNN